VEATENHTTKDLQTWLDGELGLER
jgi:hypothetical protein